MPHKIFPTLEYERAFWRDGFVGVAGLDEAGRGALAGPVVAAAVILPVMADDAWRQDELLRVLARANDSKQLAEKTRKELFEPLCTSARAFAIGAAAADEIDALNILRASQLAMTRALAQLTPPPDALLLDAMTLPEIELPQQGIIHGDARALSIAVASILAKETRDRLMRAFDAQYPHYGFAKHKGYGTRAHLAALKKFGPCALHRLSYAPVQHSVRPP
ncbi:ribonuclease HII [Anaerolineae bacterium CFX7]|nr:ribonuclease HII [Anaerolineae bacterium CFX7]